MTKYKIGDRVRCKVHDKEFIIENIGMMAPITYYDSTPDGSSTYSHKSCNGERHNRYEGVPEDDLELVEDNKSKYNFKKDDIIAVYDGDEIHVGEYTHETNDDLYIKPYKHITPTGFLKSHYEFVKVPDDTDIVYTCKDIGNNIKFGYGKIISENDDSISLDSHKEIFKKSGNIYFVRMKDLFKKENNESNWLPPKKSEADYQWADTLQEMSCEIDKSLGFPNSPASWLENEKARIRYHIENQFKKANKINNLNQEEKTMNTNFSICDFFDEILTGLDPATKILKKKKIKQQLLNNQNEINRRINSEFWEDGVTPNKKRILKINAEIVQEIKTGQKN